MSASKLHESNCLRIQSQFEGCEAIYVELLAWRVKISNIQFDISSRMISATVTEIPTKGFLRSIEPTWEIGSGALTIFSDDYWAVGYGMWSLYFGPAVIQKTLKTVSQYPEGMDWGEWNHKFFVEFFNFNTEAQPKPPIEQVFPED